MTTPTNDRLARLSLREKMGFALGDLGFNLYWASIASFLAVFYTDVFGIPAAAAGTMFLVTKIVDAITDPIMGAVADAVMEGEGNVVGIIPEVLLEWEAQHKAITELHVVTDMHVRKKMMYELCDAAVILSGGYGTLDELFEMLTWNTLKIHSKKIFMVNSNGFYDHLIAHIRHMYKEDFLYETLEDRIVVVTEPSAIFTSAAV